MGPRASAATSSSTACCSPKPSSGWARLWATRISTMLRYHFQSTKPPELRFRALLTESGDEWLVGHQGPPCAAPPRVSQREWVRVAVRIGFTLRLLLLSMLYCLHESRAEVPPQRWNVRPAGSLLVLCASNSHGLRLGFDYFTGRRHHNRSGRAGNGCSCCDSGPAEQ